MTISAKTRKMLWGRAANHCSICRCDLFVDETETDNPSLFGEEAHIVAQEPDGPRGDSPLTSGERDLYQNLILLCANDHKKVDDRPGEFTVEKLKDLKKQHETWVSERVTGYDARRQQDDEVFAAFVDEWEQRLDLAEWDSWTSGLLAHGQPSLPAEKTEALDHLCEWLFKRPWPDRYPLLVAVFENFRRVLRDLLNTLVRYGEERGSDNKVVYIEKRYAKLDRWDPEAYDRLSAEFGFAVDLVEDLSLELTRATNLVCDTIREHLLPSYRLQEGLLTITGGPFMDFTWKTYRPRYAAGTEPNSAYEGLDSFMVAREGRDVHFGSGSAPSIHTTKAKEA